jgi:hypothetical protein
MSKSKRNHTELKWREINTAPKDESLIFCFIPHSCDGYMCVMYWNKRLKAFQNTIDGGTDKPTHWVPYFNNPDGSFES